MSHGHTIAITPSDLHVEIHVDGEKVAESDRPVLLEETGLPTRYYLPRATTSARTCSAPRPSAPPVRSRARRPTGPSTVGDQVHDGIVWSYEQPIPGAEGIAGLHVLLQRSGRARPVERARQHRRSPVRSAHARCAPRHPRRRRPHRRHRGGRLLRRSGDELAVPRRRRPARPAAGSSSAGWPATRCPTGASCTWPATPASRSGATPPSSTVARPPTGVGRGGRRRARARSPRRARAARPPRRHDDGQPPPRAALVPQRGQHAAGAARARGSAPRCCSPCWLAATPTAPAPTSSPPTRGTTRCTTATASSTPARSRDRGRPSAHRRCGASPR